MAEQTRRQETIAHLRMASLQVQLALSSLGLAMGYDGGTDYQIDRISQYMAGFPGELDLLIKSVPFVGWPGDRAGGTDGETLG